MPAFFIGYIEHQILNSTQALFGNYLRRRYIDDIVGAPSCRREELEASINFVANFHPALQFTSTTSEIEVPFWTTPYKFPILKFRSLSTTKTLTLTTTSIFLLSILNTANVLSPKDSLSTCVTFALAMMTSMCDQRRWFLSLLTAVTYPLPSLESDQQSIATISCDDKLCPFEQNDTTIDRVPLVLTYNPFNTRIKQFLLQNFRILSMDE